MELADPRRACLQRLALGLGLCLAILAVYWPVRAHGFLSYDDEIYVTANPHVAKGLDLDKIRWVFTHAYAANYHPLTWLSHMLDVELFGFDAGAHHLVNVTLHTLNALLVLALARALLASTWAAAVAAALFALHPLRVESVAWASERKDVLCASLFLGTLLAYLRYGARPSPGRYALVLLLAALALLAKPMAVTLPCVALLLDYWPLARLERARPWRAAVPGGGRRLLLEKLPLVALAAAGAVSTWFAQRLGGTGSDATLLPFDLRLLNALSSYGVYLRETFWPVDLAVIHPLAAAVSAHPRADLFVPALLGTLVTGAVGLAAWRTRVRFPWLALGWCWFLGTLVPVIGLKQVGVQAHADRYTYLPLIGVAWIVAGLALALVRARAALRLPVAAALGAIVVALALAARAQVSVWSDTRTLFEHALRVTESNYQAHTVLGAYLVDRHELELARTHLERAFALAPAQPDTLSALGRLELEHENYAAAEAYLVRAARIRASPWVRYLLGRVRLAQGDSERAVGEFAAVLEQDPWQVEARFNFGQVLFDLGRLPEARAQLELAFELAPGADRPRAHNNLGMALLADGELDQALTHFEAAAAAQPGFYEAEMNTGQARLRRGELALARAAFERAVTARPQNPEGHLQLALALELEGERARAAAELASALELRPALRDDPRVLGLSQSLGRRE